MTTVRDDEAMAEYVYAIAPGWDGTIETLLLGGRVTTAFSRYALESCGADAGRRRHAASRAGPAHGHAPRAGTSRLKRSVG